MARPSLTALFACLAAVLVCAPTGARPQAKPPAFEGALDKVVALHKQLADLHPAFERIYPVAVVHDKTFYVYEPETPTGPYRLAKTAPDTINVQAGTRAAMPLASWNNRIACVVSPDAFDDRRGLILVFHEFVHCYQWETCEPRLKDALRVYRVAMERKDYMWELQYPFPYASDAFGQVYGEMLRALSGKNGAAVPEVRSRLKRLLSADEWDYMTWQEWKEGLARHLENKANARLGQPANTRGVEPPFSRVTFYAGGEALIRGLGDTEPGIEKDIERLYRRIAGR